MIQYGLKKHIKNQFFHNKQFKTGHAFAAVWTAESLGFALSIFARVISDVRRREASKAVTLTPKFDRNCSIVFCESPLDLL